MEKKLKDLSLFKKILFSFIPLVVLIILVEFFFRIIPLHEDAGMGFSGIVEPDPDLIWRLKPRAEGPYKTNELGFGDYPMKKDADVLVLVLGDSVAYGNGVEIDESFPQVAEKMMNDQEHGMVVEILNSSVPGYSTFQQLRYLELRGMDLDPDVIVLSFCLNDVVERYHTVAEFGGDNVFLGVDTRHSIQGIFGWFVRHSRAFESLARILQNVARDREEYYVGYMYRSWDRLSNELKEAWKITLSEIDQIRRLAASRGIPLVLLINPYRTQVLEPEHLNQPQKVLVDYAETHSVQVIDLLPLFAEHYTNNRDTPLFVDPNHYSIEGHKLVAEKLKNYLQRFIVGKGIDKGTSR